MEMLLRDITVFTFDIPYIYIYTWIALLGRTAAPDKPSSCATFRRKKKKEHEKWCCESNFACETRKSTIDHPNTCMY